MPHIQRVGRRNRGQLYVCARNGGGYIDWAFADAGMIDELSLVLAPAADGEQQVTVFERTDNAVIRSIAFTLTDVQNLGGNAVWLRYKFNNAVK